MRTFLLKVVKPDKTVFEGNAEYCRFTTPEGEMGVKAHHEQFMAVLKDNSTLLYRSSSGKESEIKILNGILTFKNNTCTVLIS